MTVPGGTTPADDRRWQAVLNRDLGSDSAFVYAVRSTGVYCRPWCPSRRPRRTQVLFFAAPDDAEQAGFRPCRRCRPRQAGSAPNQVGMVERLCRQIDASLGEGEADAPSLRLGALATRAGLSPYHLQRTFKRIVGVTPREYTEALRLGRLKSHLKGGKDVTTSLYEAGFSSSSRLYERASQKLGMTPATYRRGGQGMHLRYTIADSPLGLLLVAATDKGVSMVSLGESGQALEKDLLAEYPNATIERDNAQDRRLGDWVKQILGHLRGELPSLKLPVDVQATAFQWRVWKELCAIPRGTTRSYRDIAQAIGNPKAVRAVGRAIATNPVAVVIPCHRVIHQDGSLSGYRWGPERKRAILETERATPPHESESAAEGGRGQHGRSRPPSAGRRNSSRKL